MMKKFLLSGLALLVVLGSVVPSFAGGGMETDVDINDYLPVAASVAPGKLPARSVILMDQVTGRVLYEENADEQLAPASVTKIMTMLLVMEAIDEGSLTFEDMVTTTSHANSMGGTQIWLEVGEQMSVHDLLRAVATVSANDAAVALGEHLAGTEEAFAQMMNQKAKSLGMTNTNFVNASGLDAAGHVTTARDIAIMSCELLKYPVITEYTTIWMDSLRNGETQLVNTNKLIRFYDGATGLKTGTTDGAGHCLSASAERNGLHLVAVAMGSSTSDDRFSACRGLLDYGFATFEAVETPDIAEELPTIKVLGGETSAITPVTMTPPVIVVGKGEKDSIVQQITVVDDVAAPVEAGQTVGKVVITVGGEEVGEYPLICAERVEEMTFWRALARLYRGLVEMK